MNNGCWNCADEGCPQRGQEATCDDWTSRPEQPPPSPEPDPIAGLEARIAELEQQVQSFERCIATFIKTFTEA